MAKERNGAVIVAAGESRRMGFDKMMADLAGLPVLAHTVSAFVTCPDVEQIALVASKANIAWVKKLVADFHWAKIARVCEGGERRQDSVLRGLEALCECNWVAIHDGARPLVAPEIITQGFAAARQTGAAIAAVPVKDTIKVVDARGFVLSTPERKTLWAAQTPQVFRYDIVYKALKTIDIELTDDAQAVELAGAQVKVFFGSYDNIKITTPEDLVIATALLGRRVERHGG